MKFMLLQFGDNNTLPSRSKQLKFYKVSVTALNCNDINLPPSSIGSIMEIFSDGSIPAHFKNFALKCVETVSYHVDGLTNKHTII